MTGKLSLKIFLALCIFFVFNNMSGQCTGWNLAADNSVTSYSVVPGVTLIVFPGYEYTGTIYLNGGVVCNEGIIDNIELKSGILNNYGRIETPAGASETIVLNGKLVINNYTGAQYNIAAEMVISSTSSGGVDSLCIIVPKGSNVNIGTNLKLNSGRLRMNIGVPETNSNSGVLPTKIAVGGYALLGSGCLIKIEQPGAFTVSGSVEFKNTGAIKSLVNKGTLSILSSLAFSGSGGGANITVSNYGVWSVKSISSTITDAVVTLNNYGIEASAMNITDDVTINAPNTTINNYGRLQATSLVLSSGTFNNTNGDMRFSSISNLSAFNNRGRITVSGPLTNAVDAEILNTGFLIIEGSCLNNGVFNLEQTSYLKSGTFENAMSAEMVGPGDILNPDGVPDANNYATIVVQNVSKNYGSLDGYINFRDLSTPAGFDQWGPKATKGPFVTLTGAGQSCKQGIKWAYYTLSPAKSFYCPGDNLTITFTCVYPVSSVSWNYTGTMQNSSQGVQLLNLMGILTGGTVTYAGQYWDGTQYCPFSFNVVINMSTSQITAVTPVLFAAGSPTTLSSTLAGATAFNWQPNLYFTSPSTNLIQAPTVSPDISMVYTVTGTDANGCISTATAQVISQPYAHLNKTPDGGYYKTFNNKLLFKFDAQYAATTISYKILNKANAVVAQYPGTPNVISNNIVNSGDNRYYLDVSSGSIFTTGAYYTLEVTNEKNEKLYLRFIR